MSSKLAVTISIYTEIDENEYDAALSTVVNSAADILSAFEAPFFIEDTRGIPADKADQVK